MGEGGFIIREVAVRTDRMITRGVNSFRLLDSKKMGLDGEIIVQFKIAPRATLIKHRAKGAVASLKSLLEMGDIGFLAVGLIRDEIVRRVE